MPPHIAIIGNGPAALACFGVLRHAGVPAHAVQVYGDAPYPLATLECYARAIGQQQMRSESNGHLAPRDFPTLAWLDAWQRRSPLPLLASLFDAYTPSLDLLLEHSAALTQRLHFAEHTAHVRVAAVRRRSGDTAGFVLCDATGATVGEARHLVLALGLPGIAWPPFALGWQTHPCVAHAYHAAQFQAGERVAVVGSGMTAAHLWQQALAAGAQVLVIHRHPFRRQPLNMRRAFFSSAGIEAYQRLEVAQRRALLAARRASFPWRWPWERALWQARRRGAFVTYQTEVRELAAVAVPTKGALLQVQLANGTQLHVDRLVCATGFVGDTRAHPLIARIVADFHVPTVDGMLAITNDFTLPGLSQPGSICAVIGSQARWALPIAETFFSMKYVARRIVPLLIAQS